jgi:hypothetical protein
VTPYRAALRRLTALDDEAAALRGEAHRWYADRLAALEQAEHEADAAVADAARDVDQARRAVDAQAAGLWSEFVHRVGPAAERFGRAVPDPVVPRQRGSAEEYLRDVASRIAYAPPVRPLAGGVPVLLGLAGGAVGVAVGYALRWAGRAAGGDWAVVLPVLALLLALVGPVAAVGTLRFVTDRRGTGLDTTTVATVAGTGLAVIALAYALLR